jgi:nitrite reductase/ring-hydroxylating ferredoxin subunit
LYDQLEDVMNTTPEQVPSRLDPEPVPRRDFLGIASLSKKFRVMLPDSLAAGEPYVPPGRSVALFRDDEGVFAISLIRTHLGCIVKSIPDGFECPCHGSRFDPAGGVTKGPVPMALPWRSVWSLGDHSGQSGHDFGRSVRAVFLVADPAVQLGARRRPGAVHLFRLWFSGADDHRYVLPRAELGFLLVAHRLAKTLTLGKGVTWEKVSGTNGTTA